MKNTFSCKFTEFILVALMLAACGSGSSGTSRPQETSVPEPPAAFADKTDPIANDQAAADAGKQIFATNCSLCHGANAKGDGPAAASFDPKPTDLADFQSKFSDGYLFWRISEGGEISPFNSQMPAWKGLLSEDQMWQVISYLRTLGK